MEKLFKYKEFLKEYKDAILIGSSVLLGLVILASTLHHVITVISVLFLVSVCIYLLFRSKNT